MEVLGTLCALGAAGLFGYGIVIQASEARLVPHAHAMRLSLLGRLMRSARWLVGTGLTVIGWGLQILAFALVPVTVAQPALAFTLAVVLFGSHRVLREPVGRTELLAVGAVGIGLLLLVAAAPARSTHVASGMRLAVTLGVLSFVALLPFLFASAVRTRPALAATAAGVAFALAGIATKLLTDALAGRRLPAAAAWVALVALASVVGGVAEMTSLQTGRASQVVPIAFAFEIAIPVMLAPVLFGEQWSGLGGVRIAGLIVGLVAVLVGAVTLGRSANVAHLVEQSQQ
jgi:drug/metabolite transporter (DMT)-like permease